MRFCKAKHGKNVRRGLSLKQPETRSAAIESLEGRLLLSQWGISAGRLPVYHVKSAATYTPTFIDLGPVSDATADSQTPPFIPSQITQAYGLNLVNFNGITASGAGQTIAIVDAFNDPNIISDANSFSAHFGLPQFVTSGSGPTLQVLNQSGGTTLPANATPGTWDLEESLDVEWAHVVAPQANIILFEATSNASSNLDATVVEAAGFANVSTVSMSWGGPESTGEKNLDTDFTTPANHQGVTFVTSAGDNGDVLQYPSTSPNVISVGGTTLTINDDGSYGGEVAWASSGGGVSAHEAIPSYQVGNINGVSTTRRATPDVAWLADPNSGVEVLDTFFNSTNYLKTGGTSLASPMWAALIALADQGRVLLGGTTLDGPSQTLPALYSLPESDFNDIISGSNGHSATTGYDLVTGRGTPIPSLIVPALAEYGGLGTNQLIFQSSPTTATAGVTLPAITVDVEDPLGNILPGDTSQVTLQIKNGPTGGAILGTLMANAVNGIATFSGLSIDVSGQYTMDATDSTYTAASSNPLTVSPADPSQLEFGQQPTNANAGSAIAPAVTVKIEDKFNNIVTSDDAQINMGVVSGPGPFSNSSTTSVFASNGVATFNNLILNADGAYTIAAEDSADSLASSASHSFNVTGAVSAPTLSSFTVNGGAAQRSMDTLLTLVFSEPVTITNALSLMQTPLGGGTASPITFTSSSPDGGTTWNLTFPTLTGGSLPDGTYALTVTAADVFAAGSTVTMAGGDQTFDFFRLFGDYDGNGIVNNADYFQFKKTYGLSSSSPSYNPIFDYDSNGIVNNADYFQFKSRYGLSVS
jgi:hypothetical protein